MQPSSPVDSLLSAYLHLQEKNFDRVAGLLGCVWQSAGYHTQIPNGTWVHPTRENLGYTVALLAQGSSATVEAAQAILKIILPLQEKNSARPTYGVWPWLLEETLEQMRPPDWNWADFCGVRVAHMIALYSDRISPELLLQMKDALRAAAYSIFRRNVPPGYTNIAVKGGIVTGIAGELLGDAMLLNYARTRLQRFIEYSNYHGGFSEYNSPTYHQVILTEVERGLMLFRDAHLRDLMVQIHDFLWQRMTDSLHLPTGQICGPQSRAYQDLLPVALGIILQDRLEMEIPRHSKPAPEGPQEASFLIPAVPCPPSIRQKLLEQTTETFAHCEYVKSEDPEKKRMGSIWKSEDACLGSINYDNFWTQRRPILGYWPADGGLAVLRVRMTHDGQDFASGLLRSQQNKGELVALCGLVTDKGDFHDHLDKPIDGNFDIAGLQISIELTAPDAATRLLEKGVYILSSGTWSVLLQPALQRFSDHTITWETEAKEGFVAVRAVVNEGRRIQLNPSKVEECLVGFYMALSQGSPSAAKIESVSTANYCTLSAVTGKSRLELAVPLRPAIYRQI